MSGPELPPTLRASHVLRRRGPVTLLLHRDWESALPVEALLAGAPVADWGRPVAHALAGRGELDVLDTARGQLVAKVQARGGLLAGLLRRSFVDARRGWREAEASELLRARGVATPVVVVARAVRIAPLLHRLEVATARVDSRGDLLEALAAGTLPQPLLAAAAGRTLRRAHDAGLHHRDLQAKNLLVPAEFGAPRAGAPAPAGRAVEAAGAVRASGMQRDELVVLDLDRCHVGASVGERERVAALARLARSLVKQGVLPLRADGRSVDTAARQRRALAACRDFVRAYGALPGLPPARLLAAVGAELRRTLAVHAAGWGR